MLQKKEAMKNKHIKSILGIIGFLTLILIYTSFRDKRQKQLLEGFKYNWAVVVDKSESTRSGYHVNLSYIIDNQTFLITGLKVNYEKCYSRIKVGDTVFIKYSIEDKNVIELETCYWNKEKQKSLID